MPLVSVRVGRVADGHGARVERDACRRAPAQHRVDLELGDLGVRRRRRRETAATTVGQRVEVDRPARPRTPSRSAAARSDRQQLAGGRGDTGASANATSASTSVSTPPRPTMTTGPKRGSRCTPTMTSTPEAEVGHGLDRDGGRVEARDEVAVRRERGRRVAQAEHDAPGVGLVQQPHRLEHHREPQLARLERVAQPRPRRARPGSAGNGTPAAGEQRRGSRRTRGP